MKSKMKILFVEDSRTVVKRLQSSLDNAGFDVEFADNGKEALIKARQKQFDFIVTDEQMPVMSGQELCRELRSDERYADVPIIFLTGARSKLDENELKHDLGVSAIFDKPFHPNEFSEWFGILQIEHPLKCLLMK